MTDRPPDHADDLLSAHLDGELAPDEARWVNEHLDGCQECREAMEGVLATRSLLRSLPPFDATPVVEGILARHRSLIHAGMSFVGIASIVLGVLALTAAVQTPLVEPDIEAMSDAHVATEHQRLHGVRSVEDAAGMYVAPTGLVSSEGTLTRVAMYHGKDLTVVVYREQDQVVSMYEQPGKLDWSSLPDGDITEVRGRRVWTGHRTPVVAVTELGHLVVTVIADDAGMVKATLLELPDRRRGSTWDRLHDACQRFTAVFALGT